eukprot:5973832-Ditylum_brightwellii.AAC.2
MEGKRISAGELTAGDDLFIVHDDDDQSFEDEANYGAEKSLHTRFNMAFLEYASNSITTWNICIGVPKCTGIWQVGDTKQQNGDCKVGQYEWKEKLMKEKAKRGLPLVVT